MMMYKIWHLPSAAKRTTGGLRLLYQAPVNGGHNLDGPKVAKFLGG